jgi:hypothetical protein
MEGIEPSIAQAILRGEVGSKETEHGPSHYKLGFGGGVVQSTSAYGFVYNRVLRWGYDVVFPQLAGTAAAKIAHYYLRTRLG